MQKPPGFHTTAREPKRAHLRVPTLQSHHQNSTKRPPREEERMEIVAGEGKKERNFGRSGGGGRGSRGRGSQGECPNLGRTDENFEHTPHRHTTPHHTTPQHNTTQHNGGSSTGWSWAGVPRKEVHGPKIKTQATINCPEEQLHWPKFLGSRMVLKGLGTKRFDSKKRAKRRSGPKVVRKNKKHGKNKSEKNPLTFTQNKK